MRGLIKINVEDIIIYRRKRVNHSDYRYGGWYLIYNRKTNRGYVGKSIEYMFRLRQHLLIKNPKTLIDIELKANPDDFDYFLIDSYANKEINFFNRENEMIIESALIGKFKTNFPLGYNNRHYEHV